MIYSEAFQKLLLIIYKIPIQGIARWPWYMLEVINLYSF